MAFVAYTQLESGAPTNSPQTFTAPATSGTNTYGILELFQFSGATLTAVTWNGVSMGSPIATIANADGFGSPLLIYGIVGPTDGNISLTWTGGSNIVCAGARLYNDVNTVGTPATATGSGANGDITGIGSTSGDTVVGGLYANQGTDAGADTGTTSRGVATVASDASTLVSGDKTASGSSTDLNFTNGAVAFTAWGVALTPPGGGGGVTFRPYYIRG